MLHALSPHPSIRASIHPSIRPSFYPCTPTYLPTYRLTDLGPTDLANMATYLPVGLRARLPACVHAYIHTHNSKNIQVCTSLCMHGRLDGCETPKLGR